MIYLATGDAMFIKGNYIIKLTCFIGTFGLRQVFLIRGLGFPVT